MSKRLRKRKQSEGRMKIMLRRDSITEAVTILVKAVDLVEDEVEDLKKMTVAQLGLQVAKY